MVESFIECTSLQLNYDIMGIVTVSYTLVHKAVDGSNLSSIIRKSISAGGQTFTGHVTNVHTQIIPNTSWAETHVTLMTTTN